MPCEKPLLSIIVPVYDVERYLPKCIDSILAQTFTDFELILVEDGSPDNCPALCDAAAAKDARIRVIHQKNGGLSAARNAGLDAARGKWIGFVDSDDYIAPEMYEALYKAVKAPGRTLPCAITPRWTRRAHSARRCISALQSRSLPDGNY